MRRLGPARTMRQEEVLEFTCSAANDSGPTDTKLPRETGCFGAYRKACDRLESEAPMLVRLLRPADLYAAIGLTRAHGDRELMPRTDESDFENAILEGRAWGVFRHRIGTQIYDLIAMAWTVAHVTSEDNVLILIENLVVQERYRGLRVAHVVSAAAVSRAVLLEANHVLTVCATVMESNTKSLHTQSAAGVALAAPQKAVELLPELKPILDGCEEMHKSALQEELLNCAAYKVGFVPSHTLRALPRCRDRGEHGLRVERLQIRARIAAASRSCVGNPSAD